MVARFAVRRSELAAKESTAVGSSDSLQQSFQRRTWLRAERCRARVMFPGKFPRWRLRRDENDRQIKMRVCVVRIFRDGLKHFLFCLLLSTFLARSNTEVIVRGGTVWVNLNCLS